MKKVFLNTNKWDNLIQKSIQLNQRELKQINFKKNE